MVLLTSADAGFNVELCGVGETDSLLEMTVLLTVLFAVHQVFHQITQWEPFRCESDNRTI